VRLGQHSGSCGGLLSGAGTLGDWGVADRGIVGLREVRGQPGQCPPGGGSLPSLQRWGGLARRALVHGAAGEAAGIQGTELFCFSLWS
jgi:hypothetical protein